MYLNIRVVFVTTLVQELKREANEKDMMFRADMREAALEGLVETIAKNVGENDSNEKNDNNEKGIIGFK